MRFRPLSDSQLQRLSDEDLAAYAASAFAAHADVVAGRAIAMLAWGHEPWIERQVSKKIPTEHVRAVVDAVVESAGIAALEGNARFRGSTRGEYRAWLTTIVKRRVADFWRSPARSITSVRLAEELGGDEDLRAAQLVQCDGNDAVLARLEVEDALARLRSDHAEVMRLVELDGYGAAEASRRVPGMTPSNVYKIRERFRRDFAAGAGPA